MKSQVLLTVWCNISGEAAGEIWYWSLLEVKRRELVKLFLQVRVILSTILHESTFHELLAFFTQWNTAAVILAFFQLRLERPDLRDRLERWTRVRLWRKSIEQFQSVGAHRWAVHTPAGLGLGWLGRGSYRPMSNQLDRFGASSDSPDRVLKQPNPALPFLRPQSNEEESWWKLWSTLSCPHTIHKTWLASTLMRCWTYSTSMSRVHESFRITLSLPSWESTAHSPNLF